MVMFNMAVLYDNIPIGHAHIMYGTNIMNGRGRERSPGCHAFALATA